MTMFLRDEKLTFPTSISALLLRLYAAENNEDDLDFLGLAAWWVEKLEDPGEVDHWISLRLWKVFARHLHALIAANVPVYADKMATYLGIEVPMIEIDETTLDDQGEESIKTIKLSIDEVRPPFGFSAWIKPLKIKQSATA